MWAAAGLVLVAGAQSVLIGKLLSNTPTPLARVTIAPPAVVAPQVPSAHPVAAVPESAASALLTTAPQAPPPETTTEPTVASTAAVGRFGGVKVSAPIDLQVFEGGTLIGSSAGSIALTEGTHSLEVVNEALSFRAARTVTVKPGQMGSLNVVLPQGKININAAPWASVTIDGAPAGDTPLANVSLTIGSHDIVFRHPQLGEQRMTAIVKAEGVTRVSASFQR